MLTITHLVALVGGAAMGIAVAVTVGKVALTLADIRILVISVVLQNAIIAAHLSFLYATIMVQYGLTRSASHGRNMNAITPTM